MKIEVWGTTLGGQHRAVVAARSRAAAARAFNVSSTYLREYGSITGNADERAICLAEPGVVFVEDDHKRYVPLGRDA